MKTMPSRRAPVLSLAVLALCACQSEPETPPVEAMETTVKQAEIANEFTATAKVVAVSAAERTVTLQREDGVQFDVVAGEAVRNFDQIAAGDVLRVRYQERLAANVVPGGEASKAQAAVAMGQAEAGAAPRAGVGMGLSVRVKVESIDREQDIVTFSLASGELIARRIRTPEGREFVKGLKRGDVVQLDYEESLALSIDEL